MAEFIGALAWAIAGSAGLTGVVALAASHIDRPWLSPRPRYRRTSPQR